MSLPNYINETNKLLAKLENEVNNEQIFSESTEIGSGMIQSRLCGLASENGDTSVFLSLSKIDGKTYVRHLYQIKVQTSGKVKNIDSVMSLITQFESEYVFADKISVVPEQGCIYVDVYKQRKE